MHLTADEVYVNPQEDDYPADVGFRDNAANYVVVLSRFSPLEPDTGKINVLVLDQVNTDTAELTVELTRSQCVVRIGETAAKRLLGIDEYKIDFQVDEATFGEMQAVLRMLFDGLPGLTISA
jgi:hypothetical protein